MAYLQLHHIIPNADNASDALNNKGHTWAGAQRRILDSALRHHHAQLGQAVQGTQHAFPVVMIITHCMQKYRRVVGPAGDFAQVSSMLALM